MFLALILFALSLFLVLGLGGFYRAHLSFWKYADVIYYPLAAAGVVLIVFTPVVRSLEEVRQDFDREFNRVLEDQRRTETELPYVFSASDIRSSISWIELFSDRPDFCVDSEAEPICEQSRELTKLVRDNINSLEVAQAGNVESTRRICKSFGDSIVRINGSNGIAGIVSQRIIPIISDLQVKQTRLTSVENLSEYIDKIVELEKSDWKDEIGDIAGADFTIEHVAVATRYQIFFVIANEKCFTIEDNQFDEMSTIVATFDQKRLDVSEKMQREIDEVSFYNNLKILLENVGKVGWKFVIVFAMALKFGASISRLRS